MVVGSGGQTGRVVYHRVCRTKEDIFQELFGSPSEFLWGGEKVASTETIGT